MYARQTGITVRFMYVGATVFALSLGLSLLSSNQAAALLPISSLPIVGQPVADVANTALDNVVEPAVGTVTGILPKPVGDTVQAPVSAVTEAARPLIGPSAPDNPTQRVVSAILPPVSSPLAASVPPSPAAPTKSAPVQKTVQQAVPRSSESSHEDSLPLSTGIGVAFLSGIVSPLQGVVKGLSISHADISVVIATIVTMLLMTIILARLLALAVKYGDNGLQTTGESVVIRRDLTQASVLMLSLLVAGVLVIVALCLN